MHADGLAFSADLLGETTLSDAEADSFLERYKAPVATLSKEAAAWPEHPVADRGHLGSLPKASVSVKLSSIWSHLDPVSHEDSVSSLFSRMLPVFQLCREKNVGVTIDMEQWELHGIAWDVFEALVTDPSMRDWPHAGVVVQSYLASAREDVLRLREIAKKRGAPVSVRLVKGA